MNFSVYEPYLPPSFEPTPRRAAARGTRNRCKIYVCNAGARIPYDALGGGDADAETVAQGVQKGV